MSDAIDIKYSIIVVLDVPNKDFPAYIRGLFNLFLQRGDPFELLIIANGTGGFLRSCKDVFQDLNHRVKAFAFEIPTTHAVCLKAGLKESKGKIIVACGSYKQISDESILKLIESIERGVDIVSPWRQKRVDPPFNQFQSRVFNFLARKIFRTDFHDLSCTVKVFRREVLEQVKIYGNMYRFLPIISSRYGFISEEIPCDHLEERGKTGFYPPSYYLERLIDIFTLYFNTKFTRKPLRFFSALGMASMLVGLALTMYIFLDKFTTGHPIGGRWLLMLAVLSMVVGVQVASVGLLGEIIVFSHGRNHPEFTIEKKAPKL